MKLDRNDYIIGVISDTHGILRPEAEEELKGTNIIIHGGDIGDREVIKSLTKISAVKAVRGNIDKGELIEDFPEFLELKIMGKRIFVIHNIKEMNYDPSEKGYDIVISGHSHKPSIKNINGVLYFNPGSAGKKRFNLPVSIGQIRIRNNKISSKIIELKT